MRNFTMADPKELFMLLNLDEQQFPAPKSFFDKKWKKRTVDGVTFYWCGRYESKRTTDKITNHLRRMGKRYRVIKSGNQYVLWCNDSGVVDYNLRSIVPI